MQVNARIDLLRVVVGERWPEDSLGWPTLAVNEHNRSIERILRAVMELRQESDQYEERAEGAERENAALKEQLAAHAKEQS